MYQVIRSSNIFLSDTTQAPFHNLNLAQADALARKLATENPSIRYVVVLCTQWYEASPITPTPMVITTGTFPYKESR